mgnify:CR=1 FL=1
MSSLPRIEASRANGSQSHGRAQNARTHALTAFMILANESATQFHPATATELDLIEEMATAKWRQRRLWNIEIPLLDHAMEKQETEIAQTYQKIDEPTREAIAFQSLADDSNVLHNLSRYESRHRSAYYRALNHLERKKPGINEPRPKNEHSKSQPEPSPGNGLSWRELRANSPGILP